MHSAPPLYVRSVLIAFILGLPVLDSTMVRQAVVQSLGM